MKLVTLADPVEERLKITGDAHGVPAERRFHCAEELLAQPKLADTVLICTQDRMHVSHAIAALRRGYDIMMEKPDTMDYIYVYNDEGYYMDAQPYSISDKINDTIVGSAVMAAVMIIITLPIVYTNK